MPRGFVPDEKERVMGKPDDVQIARDHDSHGDYCLFMGPEQLVMRNDRWETETQKGPVFTFCPPPFERVTGFNLRRGCKAKVRIHIERVK